VRRALTRIAADEAAHAELAWRFVRWAIDAGGDEVRFAVRKAAQSALRLLTRPPHASEAPAPSELHRHGRLSESERYGIETATVRDVIQPAIDVLEVRDARRVSTEHTQVSNDLRRD